MRRLPPPRTGMPSGMLAKAVVLTIAADGIHACQQAQSHLPTLPFRRDQPEDDEGDRCVPRRVGGGIVIASAEETASHGDWPVIGLNVIWARDRKLMDNISAKCGTRMSQIAVRWTPLAALGA